MTKTILIEFGTDGSIKLEGQNFKGPECKKATAAFEAALGKVTKTTPKPEFYQRDDKLKVTQ